MPYFPCTSFYQISLDIPRINLDQTLQPFAKRLFESYQKRNSLSGYVQSHGVIGSKLILMLNKVTNFANLSPDEALK
jgi:hypothetical protein